MGYTIFRMAKCKAGGAKSCQLEHERDEETGRKYKASHINSELTKRNKIVVGGEDINEAVKRICKEHGIGKIRKNAVVTIDSFFAMSPEKTPHFTCYLHWNKKTGIDTKWLQSGDDERRLEMWESVKNDFENGNYKTAVVKEMNEFENFAMSCIEWSKETLGPVAEAVIHYDEDSPHIHIQNVPILEKEDGTHKLCARDVVGNRNKMSSIQTDLHERVGQFFGLERGQIKDPENARAHMTTVQLETQKAKQELRDFKERIGDLKAQKNEIEAKASLLSKKENSLSEQKEEVNRVASKSQELLEELNAFDWEELLRTVEKEIEDSVREGYFAKAEGAELNDAINSQVSKSMKNIESRFKGAPELFERIHKVVQDLWQKVKNIFSPSSQKAVSEQMRASKGNIIADDGIWTEEEAKAFEIDLKSEEIIEK